MGHPQTAEARPVDCTLAVQVDAENETALTSETAKKLFYREVFIRSPGEKIRIAGDRIRLSEVRKTMGGPVQKGARKPAGNPNTPHNAARGSGDPLKGLNITSHCVTCYPCPH